MTQPVSDNWERGDAYERYVGRWSRQIAPIFLDWLGGAPGQDWLDVGCGTGALISTVAAQHTPAQITAIDSSAGFLRAARSNLPPGALLLQAGATAIPLRAAAVDFAVSGLVLNFVDDPAAMLREMVRVTRPHGRVGGYVWDYADKMEFMRFFWDAVVELFPGGAALDEGSRFPLCNPAALDALLVSAGLHDVQVTAIDLPTIFTSFEDYWQPFLGGQGSAPSYLQTLDETASVRLREQLRARLPALPDGSIHLTARAWAFRGVVQK